MPEKREMHRGPTGVGTAGPGLADDVKEHLRTIAASRSHATADLDGFIKLVDLAAWGGLQAGQTVQKVALFPRITPAGVT